ncbi:MAG: DinB family protein [Acidobacteria bacterium]|nr:DinB family protein [Acidobacteriota bacterium]
MRIAIAGLMVVCTAGLASAQNDPMIAAIKSQHAMITNNLVKSAAKVSQADYAFKPTPEVRSFGALVGHVANANYMICSTAIGEKSPATADAEKTLTAKADLEKALAASLAYCDAVIGKLTTATAAESIKFFTGPTPRLGIIAFNNAHNMEHYGNMVTYMRLKGIVPPSSEGR